MNQSEIYTLARRAGLPDGRAKIAAAIAMAESGGNPATVVHDSDDDSYGLWQINLAPSAGGTNRIRQWGLTDPQQLLDPATNARVMSALSHQGQNFNPWTTFTSGRYKTFMTNQVSVVDTIAVGVYDTVNGAAAAIPGAAGWMDTVAKAGDALTRTARWVSNPKSWVRVAYVIGGGILVYAAVETLALPYTTKAVGAVMGATRKAKL